MTRQNSGSYATFGHFVVRSSWRKEAWIVDDLHPQGVLADVTPAPGCTFVRATFPPRGRGRGESLTSPRRLGSKLRALRALELRTAGYTWAKISRTLGYRFPSSAWKLVNRTISRIEHDRMRAAYFTDRTNGHKSTQSLQLKKTRA